MQKRYFLKLFYKPNGQACRFYRQIFPTWDDAFAFVQEYRSSYEVFSVEVTEIM